MTRQNIERREQSNQPTHPIATLIRRFIKGRFGQVNGNNQGNVIERTLTTVEKEQKPIQIATLWGIGSKSGLDETDLSYMAFFSDLQEQIDSVYPFGSEVIVIVADSHGAFNGHLETHGQVFPKPQNYMEAAESELNNRGFRVIRMSRLYEQYEIPPPDIQAEIDPKQDNEALVLFEQYQDTLIRAASSHSRNGDDPVQSAKAYAKMRIDERPIFEAFPNALLLAGGSTQLNKKVFPRHRGLFCLATKVPWFGERKI